MQCATRNTNHISNKPAIIGQFGFPGVDRSYLFIHSVMLFALQYTACYSVSATLINIMVLF